MFSIPNKCSLPVWLVWSNDFHWADRLDREVALTNQIADEPGNKKEVDVAADPKDDQAVGDEDDEHPEYLV